MYHIRAVTSGDLGRAVKEMRLVRGLRQDELAQRVNVARMTISRMENGQDVNMRTVIDALSECGAEIVVVPKGTPLRLGHPDG